MPHFAETPYYTRPDLTPYLIFLLKDPDAEEAPPADQLDRIMEIIRSGVIPAEDRVFGQDTVTFLDIPFPALKGPVTPRLNAPEYPAYIPYGIVIGKLYAYRNGCRPTIHLSSEERDSIGMSLSEAWRVAPLEVHEEMWEGQIFERQWRCKGDFPLPRNFTGVLVKSSSQCLRMRSLMGATRLEATPNAVIPVQVVVQGLGSWSDGDPEVPRQSG